MGVVAEIDKPLSKIKTTNVVDELAFVNEERKVLERREKELKQVLKDKYKKEGQTSFRGDKYNAFILTKEQTRGPSKDDIIRKTGKAWYEENCRKTEYQEIQISEK